MHAVDLSTIRARLLQYNIFVWNEFNYGPVRIHGDDGCFINIVIKKLRKRFVVDATDTREQVISKIEADLMLSPDCYRLTYNFPTVRGDIWIKTDHDWHFAVEFSKSKGYVVELNLKVFSSGAKNPALYEYSSSDEDTSSDEDASDEESLPIMKAE